MYQLELEREFDAPAERLFKYWTTPDLMLRWFAPEDMTVPAAEADAVVGGKFRVTMRETGGDAEYTAFGTYQVVEPNRRLVCTWQWEHGTNVSRLELQFDELPNMRCKLYLQHSEFAEQEDRDEHKKGWVGCLNRLELVLKES
ncbi:MAG: SRPBCC domain-containing protein [Chromatiales bacterium]|nr:SRPBCC domain-containing protein [Chromatiales bacterium]